MSDFLLSVFLLSNKYYKSKGTTFSWKPQRLGFGTTFIGGDNQTASVHHVRLALDVGACGQHPRMGVTCVI